MMSLIGELGIKQGCVSMLCDNQKAIHLSKLRVYHDKFKHIDVKLHFIRDVIYSNQISIEKIATKKNPIDTIKIYFTS